MNDNWDADGAHPAAALHRQPQPTITAPRAVRRRIAVVALLGLLIGLGVVAFREFTSPTSSGAVAPTDVTQLSDLDNDVYQQTLARRLAADVAAMPHTAPAAAVSAACDLAQQLTRPQTVDVDQWVTANCVADQEPHEGTRYDLGPLNRD